MNPNLSALSCHTTAQLDPWWAVDLVVAINVRGVKLTNRVRKGILVLPLA